MTTRTMQRRQSPNRRKARRDRRVKVDGWTVSAALGAVFVLHMLLFSGGLITGQHAIEPLRMFAASLTAPSPAPLPQAPSIAMAAEATVVVWERLPLPDPEIVPIRLTFAPLPPMERPRPAAMRLQHFTPDFYAELIRDAAERHDLPASLVEAVVRVESDFNARALSPKGARGLMQVMPETASRFGVDDPDHLFYPAPNLSAGTAYLAWLLKRYEGNLDLALAAYNAGEGAVANYGGIPPYRETREYVRRVRKAFARIAPGSGVTAG
jgi:soluble lytic murein transglycosylase-like protein